MPLSALLALALAATGPQHAFEDWARERARAFEQGDRATSSKTPLWRERNGSGPFLVGFSAPSSLAPLIRAVSPGVLNVLTYSEPVEGIVAGRVPTATGSGFLLGPEGYVVSNHHVVKDAQWIQVRLADGRLFDAELVGSDPDTDLALLRVLDGTDLPSVVLGDSDRLEVGDWVVAIGNPFGLDRSVSHGLISAKERVLGVGPLDDFIQTDALINPGNSGGPLFNMRGEVVGVNSAVISNAQGIGFAVPINMVKDLLPNLLDNGHVERGWLGMTVVEEPGKHAAQVVDVYPGGPAAAAGLRAGDRVTTINGRPVDSYLQLLRKISLLAPGTLVRMGVQRGTAAREFTARVVERPVRPSPAGGPAGEIESQGDLDRLGLSVSDLDAESAGRLGARSPFGAWVVQVAPNGPAAKAGVRLGDVVVEAAGQRVASVESFRSALAERAAGSRLTLEVERQGRPKRLVLETQ
ncbi:MAG TPA: trypsin-like peptidase domain-containing protein [Myxococcaceae bacterium]|nr:trypsin-like peptidase domain-containing protein [Myxococcaceae bacterium]